MKRRFAALALFAVVAMFGGSAGAATGVGSGRCDTWHRRTPVGTQWRYTDHNTHDSSDLDVAGVATLKRGTSDINAPRYGVVSKDAWIEALGGGGYGSNGYPYLGSATGEGGVVQGDVKPTEASVADVNFSVWSFSLDDEGDGQTWHDTYTGACVSANGTTVSSGQAPAASGGTGCNTTTNTTKSDCWKAPTGHCDTTGTQCDQGIVLPTSKIPVHP
jgi:hypothetical protein